MILEDVWCWTGDLLKSAVFLIDKDYAEIFAINTILPKTRILLFRFHIVKVFVIELKKLPVSEREQALIYEMVCTKNQILSYPIKKYCICFFEHEIQGNEIQQIKKDEIPTKLFSQPILLLKPIVRKSSGRPSSGRPLNLQQRLFYLTYKRYEKLRPIDRQVISL